MLQHWDGLCLTAYVALALMPLCNMSNNYWSFITCYFFLPQYFFLLLADGNMLFCKYSLC